MDGQIHLSLASGGVRTLKVVVGGDVSERHSWGGHCTAELLCLLSEDPVSQIAGIAFSDAMGGTSINFDEDFSFNWDKWGPIKYLDPPFKFNKR